MPRTALPHRRTARIDVEPLKRADHADYLRLIALSTGTGQLPPEAQHVLSMDPEEPLFTHGPALCLAARLRRSSNPRPVGALFAAFPDWTIQHPLVQDNPPLSQMLAHAALLVYGVAVTPTRRRQGIARALLIETEKLAHAAGYRMTTLIHEPELAPFYERLGYTTDRQVTIAMPDAGMGLTQPWPFMTAVKPLHPDTEVRVLPGAPGPVVTGLLPGWDLPRDAHVVDGRIVT
ncbi:GNAT family N-acetyltransferase [Streptomyces sp. NPDC059783]|uniref:GNAT family N-acetyltransferase n=1 Tax=Streptomyces sp. NPDC059783 TaxID=3346944 RepID=UPI00365D278C